MTMHLIKLSVGSTSVVSMRESIARRCHEDAELGPIVEHHTRNMPKQRDAILDGGSIYWIVKGHIIARSAILDLRQDVNPETGRKFCRICMSPDLVAVVPTKRRGFQGWRYFKDGDQPADLNDLGVEEADIPIEMASELRDLGLI